jgi:protein involved in polysaccharide export with SLBB domain
MDLYLRSGRGSRGASTPGAYTWGMMRSDVILLSFVFSLTVSLPLAGQTTPPPTRNAQASRSELQSELAQAERNTSVGSDKDRDQARMTVATLNERLTNGDFQVGDRVLIYVQGQQTLSDTFTVREGQIVHLPNLTDVDLHGVLRSELQGHVFDAVSKFLRDPVVRTGSLVRLAVLGGVAHPGFYALPADMLLSDAVMHAGGLGNTAEISHTTVTRAGVTVLGSREVTEAIKDGSTLDQLSLRAGDQVEVGSTKPSTFLTVVLPVVGGLAAVAGVIVLVTRH